MRRNTPRCAQPRVSDESAGASPQASVAAVSTDPAVVGRWTPKFAIPGVAVHAVMLHTGKILYFTGTTAGRAYLLDPVTQDDPGRLPASDRRGRERAGQHLLRGTVVPQRRHGARDGRHDRPPRGPEHDLHLRSDHRDLAPPGQHAPRALVPDPGAAGRRAHGGSRRAQRAGRAEREPRDRELRLELQLRHAAEHPGPAGPAAGGRPLPAHLPDAERARAGRGPGAERQLVLLAEPDRGPLLGGRSQPDRATRGGRERSCPGPRAAPRGSR